MSIYHNTGKWCQYYDKPFSHVYNNKVYDLDIYVNVLDKE